MPPHKVYDSTKYRRKFRGNWTYLSYYNKHVKEFFGPEKEPFLESKINISKVKYSNQRGYKSFHGSTWTSEEKNDFFKALSRHSIHRIDLIHEEIPTKTELEIYVYYDHLRTTVQKLKKGRIRHQVLKGRKTYYYEGNSVLVNYKDMPFSYEMSRWFLKFEEIQARNIIVKETLLDNDHASKFTNQTSELIDSDKLKQVMELYKQLGYTDHVFPIGFVSLRALEYAIEMKVREILLKVVQRLREVNIVQRRHILQFTEVQSNPMGKYLYKLSQLRHTGIEQDDILGSSPLYRLKEVPPVHFDDVTQTQPENLDQMEQSDQIDQMDRTEENQILTVDSLPRYDVTRTTAVEQHDLEEILLSKETDLVDRHDIKESQNHEHILLTFFATYDREKNSQSIYPDESISMLTFEDLVKYEQDEETQVEEEVETKLPAYFLEEPPKPPKRKRRTKAEMIEFRAQQARNEQAGIDNPEVMEVPSTSVSDSSDSSGSEWPIEMQLDSDTSESSESYVEETMDSDSDSDGEVVEGNGVTAALLENFMQTYASY